MSKMLSIWFRIMHCCIPTRTADSNTSTGMIRITLNMPSVAEEGRNTSGYYFTLSGEWSPCVCVCSSSEDICDFIFSSFGATVCS